ncbi:MAG: hypothetical protein V2J12_03680 [Gammaproteobacteria bacterium]|jgi:hypothetical protein|nr:hypothetical protein [Gammaproteobacteria bacterium]
MSRSTVTTSTTRQIAGTLAAAWGAIGFVWILLDAVFRLAALAAPPLLAGLSTGQGVGLVSFVVFMAYVEGYRGFQRSFAPRAAARARFLYDQPGWLTGLLAPLFCMGFFRATRRTLLIAWVGTALIVLLVFALRAVAQPYRAIVDAGVVVGLTWGAVSFTVCVAREFLRPGTGVLPEVPPVSVTGRL